MDDLSLMVEPGDIYGFIGANGAGKTSTIKSIVGIHDFDKGERFISAGTLSEGAFCKKRWRFCRITQTFIKSDSKAVFGFCSRHL